MRRMNEQEDKFEVDPDWVMPQITGSRAGRRPS